MLLSINCVRAIKSIESIRFNDFLTTHLPMKHDCHNSFAQRCCPKYNTALFGQTNIKLL